MVTTMKNQMTSVLVAEKVNKMLMLYMCVLEVCLYLITYNIFMRLPQFMYTGILCGECSNSQFGVSVLLNRCVTCHNAFGLLILVLSKLY